MDYLYSGKRNKKKGKKREKKKHPYKSGGRERSQEILKSKKNNL